MSKSNCFPDPLNAFFSFRASNHIEPSEKYVAGGPGGPKGLGGTNCLKSTHCIFWQNQYQNLFEIFYFCLPPCPHFAIPSDGPAIVMSRVDQRPSQELLLCPFLPKRSPLNTFCAKAFRKHG